MSDQPSFSAPSSKFNPTYSGSMVAAFDSNQLKDRLMIALSKFQQEFSPNPKLSEQQIQANNIDGTHQTILSALGWPVDVAQLYRRNQSQNRNQRPDGILYRPDNHSQLMAMDAKKPSELPTFSKGEKLDLAKLSAKGSNLINKINYCTYQDDAPRWLLLCCGDRLYVYDRDIKTWVIAINSALEMTTPENLALLRLLSWPELYQGNATSLKNLARDYQRKPLEAQLEDAMQEWRIRLAEMLYRRNHSHPALNSEGQFDPQKLQRAVQRVLDRLMLVQILQDKGFVNDLLKNDLDVLQNVLSAREGYKGLAGLTLQAPALYSLLNKGVFEQFAGRYGSAIFEPHLCDQLDYGEPGSPEEEALAEVMQGIMQFSFREFNSRRLGTVYERYAGFRIDFQPQPDGSVKVEKRQDMRFRKQSGTYYTPDYIVEYIVKNTLGQMLEGKTPSEIVDLRVLDPACGSGTFLIGAFEELAHFYHDWYEQWLKTGINGLPGISAKEFNSLGELVKHYPRRILERHIYGVDLNPEAAEFATVSLLLRALEWEKAHDLLLAPDAIPPAGTFKPEPLPLILNQNIKVGNSLISGLPRLDDPAKVAAALTPWLPEISLIAARRRTLCENLTLSRAERLRLLDEIAALTEKVSYGISDPSQPGAAAIPAGPVRAGLNQALTPYFGGSLEGVREKSPFNWPVEFPEVFPDLLALARGETNDNRTSNGFDCVIGNPPYFLLQGTDLQKPFSVIFSEVYSGSNDIAHFFLVFGIQLLKQEKFLGYIVTRYWLEAYFTKNLRQYITQHTSVAEIVDFGNLQVWPSVNVLTVICFLKKTSETTSNIFVADEKNYSTAFEFLKKSVLDSNASPIKVNSNQFGSTPWYLRSIGEDGIWPKVRKDTITLDEITTNTQGIKTGNNDVFTVSLETVEQFGLEKHLLIPIAEAKDVRRYEVSADKFLIYTDGSIEIEQLPAINTYLSQFKQILSERAESNTGLYPWWRLQRPRDRDTMLHGERILVPLYATKNRFSLSKTPIVGMTDVYIITTVDKRYNLAFLCAVLNSKLLNVYHATFCKVKRAGYLEFSGNKIAELPIRKINFITETIQRTKKLEQTKSIYNGSEGAVGLVAFCSTELVAGRSDVVHDVLAFLAEQMTELTHQRRELVTDFSRYVEQYPSGPLLVNWLDTLPLNKRRILPGIAQEKNYEVRRLEARPNGNSQGLVVQPGETVLSFWLTARHHETKEDVTQEVCRAVLTVERAEFIRYSLTIPREKSFPFNKKSTAWLMAAENTRFKDVPLADLPGVLTSYRTELERAEKLDTLLKATDKTIDNIVYDLYGLDEAERAIVEGQAG